MQCSDKPLRLLVVRPVAWVAARSVNNAIHLLCPVVLLAGCPSTLSYYCRSTS